jgi:flagellar hook-length control protein FliK
LGIKNQTEINLNSRESQGIEKDNTVEWGKKRNRQEAIEKENPRHRREQVEEKSWQENRREEKTGDSEKTGQQEKTAKEKLQKNGDSETGSNQGEGNQGKAIKTNQAIKEVIIKNQLQQQEIVKVKTDLTDNFSESKKITTDSQVEKVLLKDQDLRSEAQEKGLKEKAIDSRLEKAGEAKANNDKIEGQQNSEKKSAQESETEKKDGKAVINQEVKAQKQELNQEQASINPLNDFSRVLQQNGMKVDKAVAQQNLLNQYPVLQEKMVHQVENSIKLLISNGESRATIQLHPPELGRIQVDLVIHDHQVTAKINTENTAVKEVILTNLDQLKSNLANAGTQINKFDVEVGGFKNNQYEQQFSQGEGSSGRRRGGTGYEASQESSELMPDQVRNQQALTHFLGRSINCLI